MALLVRLVIPVVFLATCLWQMAVFDGGHQSSTLRSQCPPSSASSEGEEAELSPKHMYQIDSQSEQEDVSRSNPQSSLNPPNAKEPQGELFVPEAVEEELDSLDTEEVVEVVDSLQMAVVE